MQKESSCEEGEPLAVADLSIMDSVSLGYPEEGILTTSHTPLLEVLVSRESSVDVPLNNSLTTALLDNATTFY